MEQQFENIAFISYNHKDKKAAKALMRKLESFKLPTSIKKDYPEAPTKLRKIFRDEDCLTPGRNSLPQKIQDELKNSKYLVVVCSMNSAKSEWVNEEVKFFKELKREKFIIPYIIDGEPNSEDDKKECYMPELRSITGKDELYAVNIAENGDKHAQVKVIAGLILIHCITLYNTIIHR